MHAGTLEGKAISKHRHESVKSATGSALQGDLTAEKVRALTPWEIKDYIQDAYSCRRESSTPVPRRVSKAWSLMQQVVAYFTEQRGFIDDLSLRAFVPVGRRAFADALITLLRYGKVERRRVEDGVWVYWTGSGSPRRALNPRKVLAESMSAEWFIRQCKGCAWLDRAQWFATATQAVGVWTCSGCGLTHEDFELPRMWLFDIRELDEAIARGIGEH